MTHCLARTLSAWFSQRKRYGFIATKEGEEAFFHEKQLLEGCLVAQAEHIPIHIGAMSLAVQAMLA